MSLYELPQRLLPLTWLCFFIYWGISARAVNKTEERGPDYSPHLLLTVLSFVLVFPSIPLGPLDRAMWPSNPYTPWIGLALTLLCQAFAVWARIHLGKYWSAEITLKEGHQVIQTGPYAMVRHPIYTGLVLGMLATAVGVGEWRSLIAFIVMSLAYTRKIRNEEAFLVSRLGEEYIEYRKRTKIIVPYLF